MGMASTPSQGGSQARQSRTTTTGAKVSRAGPSVPRRSLGRAQRGGRTPRQSRRGAGLPWQPLQGQDVSRRAARECVSSRSHVRGALALRCKHVRKHFQLRSLRIEGRKRVSTSKPTACAWLAGAWRGIALAAARIGRWLRALARRAAPRRDAGATYFSFFSRKSADCCRTRQYGPTTPPARGAAAGACCNRQITHQRHSCHLLQLKAHPLHALHAPGPSARRADRACGALVHSRARKTRSRAVKPPHNAPECRPRRGPCGRSRQPAPRPAKRRAISRCS